MRSEKRDVRGPNDGNYGSERSIGGFPGHRAITPVGRRMTTTSGHEFFAAASPRACGTYMKSLVPRRREEWDEAHTP